MGTTTRFGLEWFDADEEGSISDKAGKYTGTDRLVIDRLLATLEGHDHKYQTSTDLLPDGAPDAALGTDGSLDAGFTYYYSISFVDENGLETPIGDEVSVETPDILPAPDAPSGETVDGGDLTTGTYDYGLTAVRDTEQSVLGNLFAVTLVAGEGSVDLTLPDLGDADSYNIWRRKDVESGFTLIGNDATGSFTDDGSVSAYPYPLDPTYAPPSDNEGVDIYSVTIDLNVTDAVSVQEYAGWKLYRTIISEDYPSQSLVAFVTERVDEFDPESDLVTSYIDLGDELVTGSPTTTDLRMLIQPLGFDIQETAPDPTPYPEGYPLLVGETPELQVRFEGAWTAVGGGGGDPFSESFKGEWDATAEYVEGDVVRLLGHLFLRSAGVSTDPPAIEEFFYDDFERANSTDLGAPWLEEGSDLLISSGAVVVSYSSQAYASMGPSAILDAGIDVDPWVAVDFTHSSGSIGILLCVNSDMGQYTGILLDGTDLKIYDNGDLIDSVAQALGASGNIKATFSRSTGILDVYIDDVSVYSDSIVPYPRAFPGSQHGFSLLGSDTVTGVGINVAPTDNNWQLIL